MIGVSDIDQVSSQRGIPVQLSIGATLDSLAVIRSLVDTVLLSAEFSLADTADVTLGVDEICTQIVSHSVVSGSLRCTLLTGPGGVAGEISGVLRQGLSLPDTGFGWHVITSVTDAVVIDTAGDDGSVCVRFVKVRSRD